MIPTIENAIALASLAHKGQVDKQGAPYILHPLRVMLAFTDPIDQMIAVLHDAVEDSTTSLGDLRALEFPEDVIQAVDALTRRKDVGETYRAFIERVKANPRAVRVKVADINDNLARMTSDIASANPDLAPRYAAALQILAREFCRP